MRLAIRALALWACMGAPAFAQVGMGVLPFGGVSSTNVLWTPLNDVGLVVWFNPQDTGKITLSSGKVASFTDESNQQTATQATGSAQLNYSTTINGLTVLSGNGTSQFLATSAFTHPQNWVVSAVVEPFSVSGISSVFVGADAFPVRQAQYLTWGNTTLTTIAFNSSGANFNADSNSLAANTPAVVSAILDSTPKVTSAINGTDGTPSTVTGTPAAVSLPLQLGAITAGSEFMDGALGDVILTATATTSIKQKCEGFLAWKYGLQGNLPSGHPYKSRPPFVSDP